MNPDARPENSPPAPRRILVIGYGNPGRRDDGLGPALAARVEALHLPGVTVEIDYQLSIEHAELAARHDLVVFVDAASDVADGAAFYLRPVEPAPATSCFSHSVSPSAVLQLAAECFGARPAAWLLGIGAQDLESMEEGLTAAADGNLAVACFALLSALETGQPGSGPASPGDGSAPVRPTAVGGPANRGVRTAKKRKTDIAKNGGVPTFSVVMPPSLGRPPPSP